jgi:acylpyruvate hydrolase
MKLATLRTATGTTAVVVTDDSAIEIPGVVDVGALLGNPGWRAVAEAADGKVHPLDSIEDTAWAPVVPQPSIRPSSPSTRRP